MGASKYCFKWISSYTLWNLVVLYGVSVVLLDGGLKWNLGDGNLLINIFAKVRKLFGERELS